MRRQSSTGFAWPAPTTSPRWPRSGKPMSAKPGKPWMPATNRRSGTALAASRNRLLWLAEAQQHPRGFVLAHLWQIEDGQARVGEIAELYVLPQARRQGLARELVGSAEEALRSRGAGLIRAQSALDAPLSNLFWQGLGWDADYLTFTRY